MFADNQITYWTSDVQTMENLKKPITALVMEEYGMDPCDLDFTNNGGFKWLANSDIPAEAEISFGELSGQGQIVLTSSSREELLSADASIANLIYAKK